LGNISAGRTAAWATLRLGGGTGGTIRSFFTSLRLVIWFSMEGAVASSFAWGLVEARFRGVRRGCGTSAADAAGLLAAALFSVFSTALPFPPLSAELTSRSAARPSAGAPKGLGNLNPLELK
jgi:hypothetical protein